MSGKYTPGPWVVEEDGWISSEDGDPICMIQEGGFNDLLTMFANDRANAGLIAAAPDLLEACKAMLEYANVFTDSDAHRMTAAAIAKAEGRT